MNGLDAIRAAFAQVRKHAELVALEILWKWAWAGAVVAVGVGSGVLFLDSATISPAELRGLSSGLPWLVALTLRRLWQRHAAEFIQTATIVVLAAAVLWWLAASIFRSGIAGGLVQVGSEEENALAHFGPSVRRSLSAYLGSYFWSLAVAAATLWLAVEILLRMPGRQAPSESEGMPGFLTAVLGVAGLLFFWQFVAWMFGLGRAVASRRGWGFVRSLGFALNLFGTRMVDVLFTATTMFLFRVMAMALAGALGMGIIYGAVVINTRLAGAGLITALMLISVPARGLFVVQQAAYLEIAREEVVPEHQAWVEAK